MAARCTAFRDRKGNLYETPALATEADLAAVLGRVGEGGGLTDGVAKKILEKRAELEAVFAEHDAMELPQMDGADPPGELSLPTEGELEPRGGTKVTAA